MKRRLGIDDGSRSEPSSSSSAPGIGQWMHDLYKTGTLSSRDLVRGARAETVSNPGVSKGLAQLGRTSDHNAHRTVMRKYKRNSMVPEPYRALAVFWDHTQACKRSAPMDFIPFHEVLASIVEPKDADKWCSYPPEKRALEDQLVETCNRLKTSRDGMAGLGIWGDYAEYDTSDNISLLLWCIMTGDDHKRYWLGAFSKRTACKCGCRSQCTMRVVYDVVAWMLKTLLTRVFPSTRHDGVRFEDSHFPGDAARARLAGKPLPLAAVIQRLFADWQWHKCAYELTGWRDGPTGACCFLCGANCTTHPWTDPRLEATWRGTTSTRRTYGLHLLLAPTPTNGIWSWPGLTIEMAEFDWMHTVDLGVTTATLGNIYWELVHELGGSITRNLEACGTLLAMIVAAAHALSVEPPINTLTISMIRASTKTKPVLKTKAAESRYLVPITHFILTHFVSSSSPHAALRLQTMDALNNCYRHLHDWGPSSTSALAKSMRQFCLLYNILSLQALADHPDGLLWRLSPKFHSVHHITECGYNPKETWNYQEESIIGGASGLAETLHARTLATSLIQTYRNLTFGQQLE